VVKQSGQVGRGALVVDAPALKGQHRCQQRAEQGGGTVMKIVGVLDGDVGLTHQRLIHVRIIKECQDCKNEEINESSARLGFTRGIS
jgi:hypothetical protein